MLSILYVEISFKEALEYYSKIAPVLFFGVILSKLILNFDITKIRDLKFINVKKTFNFLFLISFLSPLVANIFLSEFARKKIYKEREVIFVALLLSFPKYTYHMILTLPIIVPLLKFLAIKYFALVTLTILTQLVIVLLFVTLLKININKPVMLSRFDKKFKIRDLLLESIKFFLKISAIFLVVTFLMLYLYNIKVFEELILKKHDIFNIDINLLSILTSYLVKPILSYTIASNLLELGYDENRILYALVLSSYISFYIFAIRHLLPTYTSIFGLKIGPKIILYTFMIRTPIYILFAFILYNILYI